MVSVQVFHTKIPGFISCHDGVRKSIQPEFLLCHVRKYFSGATWIGATAFLPAKKVDFLSHKTLTSPWVKADKTRLK